MRHSLYWDDFSKRVDETVTALKAGSVPPVRRIAVFITNQCNFRCSYCNMKFGTTQMKQEVFDSIVKKYGDTALIHITGGEPSLVKWLYPYIDSHPEIRFHLNTNAYLKPPKNVKRLKISLDSHNEQYFNYLVKCNAWKNVVQHIKESCEYTTTSITCVLSKQNYQLAPEFMYFCRNEFPNLYAVFFSIYKGTNPAFKFDEFDVNNFFKFYKPSLETEMDTESLALWNETADEKKRLIQGERFPENTISSTCYLSLSERVINWDGEEAYCSHLFRDKVCQSIGQKKEACKYGCNRRLVQFNQEVEKLLGE